MSIDNVSIPVLGSKLYPGYYVHHPAPQSVGFCKVRRKFKGLGQLVLEDIYRQILPLDKGRYYLPFFAIGEIISTIELLPGWVIKAAPRGTPTNYIVEKIGLPWHKRLILKEVDFTHITFTYTLVNEPKPIPVENFDHLELTLVWDMLQPIGEPA